MRTVENRPVPCHTCGTMVQGRESAMHTPQGLLRELRWTCPKCGLLVRVDEEYDETEADKQG